MELAERPVGMELPEVRLLPDPVLSTPARPFECIDDEARAVGDALLRSMRETSHSVGVAAPQIGIDRRAFCVDVTGHRKARSCHGEVLLFNPELVLAHGREVGREGCMSVPDLTGDVERHTLVVVQGLDLDGRPRVIEADAFEARAIQHELDHLDGLVFLDRVVAADRVFSRRRYR
jgi:peptide deformylase